MSRYVTQDPDYSPKYQDEYQRLWHQAAADLARAAAERDAFKAALVEIAQADAKTPVLALNRIAESALTAAHTEAP